MDKYSILEFFPQNYAEPMDNLPHKNDLKEFLTLSLDRCMKAVDARSGSIFLLDEDKKELVLEIAKNFKEVSLEGTRERLGQGVAGKVALERKPFLVEDIDSEPDLSCLPRYHHYDSKSFLSVPLEVGDDLIGVVNVTDKTAGGAFDGGDLQAVSNICRYLGTMISGLKDYLDKQKKLNEEFAAEIKDLKRTVRSSRKFSSLGKLVSGLVHEVNNPLDGVIRYINLAYDCVEEEEGAVREYLKEAKTGLVRIARIVRSLLDFSWSLSPGEGRVDINHTIEESLFLLNRYMTTYNIKVERSLSPYLPKIADLRLKLVFSNIIKNACEAMKGGGTLSIYTKMDRGNIEIIFKDTGEGIPFDLQEKIFDPFFTTKNIGEGSGLGLAISSEIIQRYKGNIFLETMQGEGATFIIQIPAAGSC